MNVRLRCVASILVGALALLGCASAPGSRDLGAAQRQFQPAESSDIFLQTQWVLARWTHPDGRVRALPSGSRASPWRLTLAFFHQQGVRRVSGSTGCNDYSADYTVANGRVILTSDPVVSLRACAAGAQAVERDYLAGLPHILASALDDTGNPGRLALTFDNGDVLFFDRVR